MDAIILDVDGTLWDSRQQVADSWNLALSERFGFEKKLTADMMTPLFGKTMDKIIDALFPGLDEEMKQKVTDACFEYENRWLMETPGFYYDGVEETLPLLAENYPLFIVSNCQSGYIEALLKHLGSSSCIRDFLCYGDTGKQKEETILMLMEKHHLSHPVYVGDTSGDAVACRKAGIPIIFADYGLGEIEEQEYIARIHSFPELVSVMEGLR